MICNVCETQLPAADAIVNLDVSDEAICPNCNATFERMVGEEMGGDDNTDTTPAL